ncbi:MAG: hypothetical protein JF585_02650 [Burkholderiales bacterium]|nr:hypothetical protein [Burkholderiales bacterium]
MRFPDPDRFRHAAPAAFLAALLAGCATHAPAPAPAPEPRRVELPTDTGLPAGAARALAQRFPALHPVGHSAGHLQVDDADDLAVVLAPQGQSSEPIIAVLVTGAGGDYRIATVSKPIAPGCDTCTTTIDIARKLLSVHVMRPSDPEFERVTWQFGYTDDALRLVDVTAAQPAGDDPIAHGYAISTNLLTGAKVDTLDPTLADPSRRRELKSSVPLRRPIAFDAFDFTPQALGPELRRQPLSAFEPQDALPASAVALLRKSFPGATLTGRSAGPLRPDGPRDLVVVLDPAGNGDTDTTLALLLAQPDGGFRLGATSGPLTRNCRGCDVQVQIAHHALVVQTTSVDGAATHLVGWQFMAAPKDKPGALRLVGVRTVLASRSGADSHRYVNTANLLTGDKLDVVEDVVRGHRKRAEHSSKVAVRAPLPLAGFAFDASKLDAETRRDFTP